MDNYIALSMKEDHTAIITIVVVVLVAINSKVVIAIRDLSDFLMAIIVVIVVSERRNCGITLLQRCFSFHGG